MTDFKATIKGHVLRICAPLLMASLAAAQAMAQDEVTLTERPEIEALGPQLLVPIAATGSNYLLPQDVLAASLKTFPQIQESLERRNIAEGRVQEAEGEFDTVISSDGFSRTTGFWSGTVARTEARRNLRENGISVYGGYRLSDGRFPIYEDENFTNSRGEVKVGAVFAILRNRNTDRRRFNVRDAQLVQEAAELDVLLTKLSVQQRALNAYWRWVAAGRKLEIYKDLLDLAQERDAAMTQKLSLGAIPAIDLTESRQSVIRRKILVEQAERDLQLASNDLGFFNRSADNRMVVPDIDEMPPYGTQSSLTINTIFRQTSLDQVMAQRPEFEALKVAIERAEQSIALGENDLKPALNLQAELSRDIGIIAEGGPSRDSTDVILGFNFSVPLGQNSARGRIRQAEARLRAIEAEAVRLQNEIEIGVTNILLEFTTSLELADLAREYAVQSDALVEAEKKKFESGASSFFLVNLREEAAADAQISYLRADLAGRLAKTAYSAATMDLAFLGLETVQP